MTLTDRIKILVIVLLLAIPFWIVLAYLSHRYKIAYDPQPPMQRCLYWRWYLIDTSKKKLVDYHYDDLVSITAPKNDIYFNRHKFIKKVVAFPNEIITQKHDHIVARGKPYHSIINNNNIHAFNHGKSYRVPDGHLFVVGNNPLSFDSTYFGPVSQENIIGKAYGIW